MHELLKADYVYNTTPTPTKWVEGAAHFMFDQPKLNMLWLVFPGFDEVRHTEWAGNEYTTSINTWLDKETRSYLQGPPGRFLEYWLAVDERAIPKMAELWPDSYIQHMITRVGEVEARLRAEVPDNAVIVDFKRRAKVA